MFISSWNIRGLNQPPKQKEITNFVRNNHIDVLGIIESKVRKENQQKIQTSMLPGWEYLVSNTIDNSNRIWVTWNPKRVQVTSMKETKQILHVSVLDTQSSKW